MIKPVYIFVGVVELSSQVDILTIAIANMMCFRFISVFAPGLLKYSSKVGISIVLKEAKDFFIKVTKRTIEARELQGKEVICLPACHV